MTAALTPYTQAFLLILFGLLVAGILARGLVSAQEFVGTIIKYAFILTVLLCLPLAFILAGLTTCGQFICI